MQILVSCEKCQKARVCACLRAIAPLLASWDEETRPFEADKLASICREYVPTDELEAFA